MSQWMIRVYGRKPMGPITTELVVRGLQTGRIPVNAEVREAGARDWCALAQIEEFYDALGLDDAKTALLETRVQASDAQGVEEDEDDDPPTPRISHPPDDSPRPPALTQDPADLMDADDDEADRRVFHLSPPPEVASVRPAAGVPAMKAATAATSTAPDSPSSERRSHGEARKQTAPRPEKPDELTAPSLRIRRQYTQARWMLFAGLVSLALALLLVVAFLLLWRAGPRAT